MTNKTIKINKKDAIERFFIAYNNINSEVYSMNTEELGERLTHDIIIGCTSAATKIPEKDFVNWAVDHAGDFKK